MRHMKKLKREIVKCLGTNDFRLLSKADANSFFIRY
jgi:hypothetical protein